MLDTSRARERFGFQARTGFEEGLRRTIEWYVSTLAGAPARKRRQPRIEPVADAGDAPDRLDARRAA